MKALHDRPDWEAHPNFFGPAATLLSIHDQFREASRQLATLIRREIAPDLSWLSRVFRPLAQTLHHHHHAEEALLFPMVLRQTGVAPEELVTDHEELTAAIAEVQASFVTGRNRERAMRAVASFDEMLVAHLAREESLVVPSCSSFPPSEPGP